MNNRRVVLATFVAFSLTLLTACEINPYVGPSGAPRVAVVGDSITAEAATDLSGKMLRYQISVTGIPGIGQVEGRTRLVQPTVATQPDVIVIELGVNSALKSWDGADIPHLEGIMSDAANVPCVVYVTPSAMEPSYYDNQGVGTMKSRLTSMRNSIARRVATRPNFHLADWGAASSPAPSWFDTDGLHNTPAGQRAYGAYVSQQVSALCYPL